MTPSTRTMARIQVALGFGLTLVACGMWAVGAWYVAVPATATAWWLIGTA